MFQLALGSLAAHVSPETAGNSNQAVPFPDVASSTRSSLALRVEVVSERVVMSLYH